jgi:hypothetical protein
MGPAKMEQAKKLQQKKRKFPAKKKFLTCREPDDARALPQSCV